MADYKTFTVRYQLDKDEQEALSVLTEKFREYVSPEGRKPFAGQTEEQMFDFIMQYGSRNDISGKIGYAMVRMGIMSVDEWLLKSREHTGKCRKSRGYACK